uniref:Protein kinase domain-containing protein n=1 Tax=Periophthalmus magnuspinnatus TaxID=409849 RepID=A0A3B4AVL9_9GOBI
MSSAMTLTNVPNKDAHTDPETKYESVELLGEGAFGKVAMCRNRATNEIVAVKLVHLTSADFLAHQSLQHDAFPMASLCGYVARMQTGEPLA